MTIDEEIDHRYADWLLRKAIPNGECLECHLNPNAEKYPKVGGNEMAHRFIYRVKKKPPEELYVLHKCNNMRCINLDHLFLGTPKDNVHDCIAKGRATYLKGRPSTIPNEVAERMKELRASGVSANAIATEFSVKIRLVYRALSGAYDAPPR